MASITPSLDQTKPKLCHAPTSGCTAGRQELAWGLWCGGSWRAAAAGLSFSQVVLYCQTTTAFCQGSMALQVWGEHRLKVLGLKESACLELIKNSILCGPLSKSASAPVFVLEEPAYSLLLWFMKHFSDKMKGGGICIRKWLAWCEDANWSSKSGMVCAYRPTCIWSGELSVSQVCFKPQNKSCEGLMGFFIYSKISAKQLYDDFYWFV